MLWNNKFLGKCWYGRHPWIRLAMESESMVEKGINFILCLGNAYDISIMESIGNYSVIFVERNSMPPEMFLSMFFALSSGTSTNPYFPLRRAFLLLYAIFFIWVVIFSYKAPTRGHYDRTWALSVANMRVCFMDGSMIEHKWARDNLL
mgnify:CR=1 FL=1